MTTDQQKTGGDYKFNAVKAEGTSSFAAYRRIMYGETSLGYVIMAELIVLCFSWVPGALGLLLRKWFYPLLFKQTGGGVVFGRNMTLRHARKISLGAGVVLDDNVVLDAKGDTNDGITIGDGVYIGRNTIIYCKNGNIHLENNVNISSNCQLFSANDLRVGEGSVIAAYVYLLSGGQYDIGRDAPPFSQQTGMQTSRPTHIGRNSWLGAGVVVVDGVTTGEHVVVGAGAVVTGALPEHTLALGIPAKPVKTL